MIQTPLDWYTYAPGKNTTFLSKHYGLAFNTIKRLARDTGVALAVGRPSRYKQSYAEPPRSRLDDAAHYLRKFYRSVHRCDIPLYEYYSTTWGQRRGLKNGGKGFYFVDGLGIVANDNIIELACSKGWRAA